MELMAAIQGLEALKRPCHVRLFTDSVYVKDGVTKWIHGWKKNGWKHVRQEAGEERRALAAPRRRAQAVIRSNGTGSKAIAAIPRTSAPTAGARRAIAKHPVTALEVFRFELTRTPSS
jgi:hypothetical protein